jgi:beta-galactosidase
MAKRKRKGKTRIVKLGPGGLELDGEHTPLFAGAVNYYELRPQHWRSVLAAVRELGLRLVDTRVPWSVHELRDGKYDFGEKRPELDVARFLRLAEELGLLAIIRPGPHQNADLALCGIPERIIWDPDCQARSASGKRVLLPLLPLLFPAPSYASQSFLEAADRWLSAAAGKLRPLRWPDGPIVIMAVDDVTISELRDGPADRDYHPDAILAYRQFIHNRYDNLERLRKMYGDPSLSFSNLEPPRRMAASTAVEICPFLDWLEFREQLVAQALKRMTRTLRAHGLDGIPTVHDLRIHSTAALGGGQRHSAADLLSLSLYGGSSPEERRAITRDSTELAARARASGTLAYSSQLRVGFSAFAPARTTARDSFCALVALASGLQGFTLHMAVEQTGWIGAPISASGTTQPEAGFWQSFVRAAERLRLHELHPAGGVTIVVPDNVRRLTRALNAFAPLGQAFFNAPNLGVAASCLEDHFGLPGRVALDTDEFSRMLEAELEALGIPFLTVGSDLMQEALRGAWTVVLCPGSLEVDLSRQIAKALSKGKLVSVGPHFPDRDQHMMPLERAPFLAHDSRRKVPSLLGMNRPALRRALQRARDALDLFHLSAAPREVFVNLLCDAKNQSRVLCVGNPTERAVNARVSSTDARHAVDVFDGERLQSQRGTFRMELRPQSVRILELYQSL